MSNPINSISPLDGRYHNKTELLRPYFSESALIKYRIQVEIEYLISLSKEKKIPELKPFSEKEKKRLKTFTGHTFFNVVFPVPGIPNTIA